MPDAHVHESVTHGWAAAEFVHKLHFRDLPQPVVAQAQRCLLDLIGVAAAGTSTTLSRIVTDHAIREMGASGALARILLDGRTASRAGAAFAGAATIDSFDAHDGHVLTKGHAGVAVLPALLAFVDADGVRARDGGELIAHLVIGYEIATRAGIALHSTVADYHCSGAWNALGAAAVGARCLGLDTLAIRHAFGIAEYFGACGQMMRVCASPTMLKDGSGWGAHAGVTAALLAAEGFTGAPAATVENDAARALWSDLGERWRILEQYFKAYPVCRWAQPAIEAALSLVRAHALDTEDIARVEIETFHEAAALGASCGYPLNTEEAQYSVSYPVAAALTTGRVGADEIGDGVRDARIQRLFEVTGVSEDDEFSRRFPAERWARVYIVLRDGQTLRSKPKVARGGSDNPLSDDVLRRKYRELAEPVLGPARAARIEQLVADLLIDATATTRLVDELLQS